MRILYSQYSSKEDVTITLPKCKIYTDFDGIPNELALWDFMEKNKELSLASFCCDINQEELKKGIEILKQDFCVFKTGANQYYIPVKKEETQPVLEAISNVFKSKNIKCEILNKFIKDNNWAESKKDLLIKKQELWKALIVFKEQRPILRTINVHVFPTEYKPHNMTVNQIVVVDDLVYTRIFTGNSVSFGFDGNKFIVSSRFDKDGNLCVMCFRDKDSKGTTDMNITVFKGTDIPQNFGKKIREYEELYPIKPLPNGGYSYVLFNKNSKEVFFDENGMIEVDGELYAVGVEDKGIELIKVKGD